jgi:hypothetical protein
VEQHEPTRYSTFCVLHNGKLLRSLLISIKAQFTTRIVDDIAFNGGSSLLVTSGERALSSVALPLFHGKFSITEPVTAEVIYKPANDSSKVTLYLKTESGVLPFDLPETRIENTSWCKKTVNLSTELVGKTVTSLGLLCTLDGKQNGSQMAYDVLTTLDLFCVNIGQVSLTPISASAAPEAVENLECQLNWSTTSTEATEPQWNVTLLWDAPKAYVPKEIVLDIVDC